MKKSLITRATVCLFLCLTATSTQAISTRGGGVGAYESQALERPAELQFASDPSPQLGAQSDASGLRVTGLSGGSIQWTIVILLTLLALIPSLLICMTPFARLLIVFHFLRQALGLQTTPSNQTLVGLSLIMTFFLMQPVGATIFRESVQPFQEGRITALVAVQRG